LYRVQTSDGGRICDSGFHNKDRVAHDCDIEAKNFRLSMNVGADLNGDVGYQKVDNSAIGTQIK
jgi:hypothetical protein